MVLSKKQSRQVFYILPARDLRQHVYPKGTINSKAPTRIKILWTNWHCRGLWTNINTTKNTPHDCWLWYVVVLQRMQHARRIGTQTCTKTADLPLLRVHVFYQADPVMCRQIAFWTHWTGGHSDALCLLLQCSITSCDSPGIGLGHCTRKWSA